MAFTSFYLTELGEIYRHPPENMIPTELQEIGLGAFMLGTIKKNIYYENVLTVIGWN